jgi:hypothetical protein
MMRTVLGAFWSCFLVAAAAPAGDDQPMHDFYRRKALSTSAAAFARAEARLRELRPGMLEHAVLAAIEMEVLTRHGKPYDALVDGYLLEASHDANRGAAAGERYLVFGWVDGSTERPRVSVRLVDRRLAEVVWLAPALVARAGGDGP